MDVKGNELKVITKYAKEKLGEDGYQGWLSSLPEDSQRFYTRAIMASMWYPVQSAYVIPFDLLMELVSPGDKNAGAMEFGRWSGRDELSGIYSVFLKMGSPNKMVSIASMMYGKFYNEGDMQVVDNEPGMARFRLVDAPLKFEPWEHSTAGWSEVAVEMAGGKDVKVVIEESFARGDGSTLFKATWQ